jgi:hypothetical protein
MITTKSIAFLAALGYGSGIDMPHHQPAILSVIDAVLSPSRLDATQAQESRFEHRLEQRRTL